LILLDVPQLGSTITIQCAKIAISNIRENISQTVSNTATVTINRQQEIACRWFAVDFLGEFIHALLPCAYEAT